MRGDDRGGGGAVAGVLRGRDGAGGGDGAAVQAARVPDAAEALWRGARQVGGGDNTPRVPAMTRLECLL